MKFYIDDQPAVSSTGTVPRGGRDNYNIMLGGTLSPPNTRTDPTSLYINGEFAELQFYSGALNGQEATNLINSLKSNYGLLWPDQALCSISAANPVEDIGSNILCTVTIPQGLNASHSVTVTVTSGSPGVVTTGGGSSTNIVFATGTTNVKSFSVTAVSAGTSLMTAASSGLVSDSVTLSVQPAPFLVEAFRAYSLTNQQPGIVDGGGVGSWAGDINSGAVANQNNPNAPVFHTPATPSGAPSVSFNSSLSNSMVLLGNTSPLAGVSNFSVALVFKATAASSSASANWYSQSGILDAEESGAHNDWGIAVNGAGALNFGVGNPDVTLANSGYNLVNNSVFHVAVVAFDLIHQTMSVTVDDKPTTVTLAGTPLSRGPRDPSALQNTGGDIHFGQGSTDGLFWNGELVEADFYNGAIKNPSSFISALKTGYGVSFPSEVLMSLTPVTTAIRSNADLTLTLAIPSVANQSHPVTVYITNSNTSAVSLPGAIGNLLQVTFGTGATNVQTILAHGAAIGATTLTYSSSGLVPGADVRIQVIENPGKVLVGQWAFNDLAHPFVDSSGFRPAGIHDGVAVGNVSFTNDVPPGLTGYSLNLLSTGAVQILNTRVAEGDYLDTFDDVLESAMSITAWVKLNGASDPTIWIPFVCKRGEENSGYQLRRFSTGPFATFTLRNTAGLDDPNGLTAYEDGTWHHIAGVWDGATGVRSLYVDGFLEGNASLTNDFGIPAMAPTNSLVIGARDHANDGSGAPLEAYFTGLIKDVRIFNYALNQTQVRTAKAGQTVVPLVTLNAQRTNGSLVLTWSDGKLQQAPSVTGPYTNVTSATSPYTVPTTAPQSFFRVQVSP